MEVQPLRHEPMMGPSRAADGIMKYCLCFLDNFREEMSGLIFCETKEAC